MTSALVKALVCRCEPPTPDALASAVQGARDGSEEGRLDVCAAMIWTAFAAPAASTAVFDKIASVWLNQDRPMSSGPHYQTCPLPERFWQAFDAVLEGSDAGYDAASITTTVAALNASVDEQFGTLAEDAASSHPGSDHPAEKVVPGLLSLTELAQQPAGSLARDLHSMWVDNGFDPEVLDRAAIGLERLPPALRYLNTRILQMHDVWHLVAGYQTTALHEIAISAFQLAQFGHNYSGQFLATVACISHRNAPEGFGLLVQTICEAWQHGRHVPPLMAIEWEQCWHKDVTSLRDELSITAFEGSFPADIIEQLRATAT